MFVLKLRLDQHWDVLTLLRQWENVARKIKLSFEVWIMTLFPKLNKLAPKIILISYNILYIVKRKGEEIKDSMISRLPTYVPDNISTILFNLSTEAYKI